MSGTPLANTVGRQRNYAYSTEQSYTNWIKRYIIFHDKKHPRQMGEKEIEKFLTWQHAV